MKRLFTGIVMALAAAACGPAPVLVAPPAVAEAPAAGPAPERSENSDLAIQATDQPRRHGPWIGAAGETELLLPGTNETVLGVWVDVPAPASKTRSPADVALVIDTSGSMAGAKIDNARLAAHELVDKLADGDIVSISTFSDEARTLAEPTVLDRHSRMTLSRVIDGLRPQGGTNMFDGLRMAEQRAASGPPSHPVRRVVMISDGMANIGPSSPEVLGSVAARGADSGVQVSAIGVGLDYDERTLNALAVRSSGRLYHLDEPRDMTAILDREVGLLQATAATGAFVEIASAPGVTIVGADGVRFDWQSAGVARVPLGTMFGGQHREMVLRVRVNASAAGAGEAGHALASVRLHFHDPSDGGVERVQEVVARYQVTTDRARVEASYNDRTRTIVASQAAARITVDAAQQVNDGRFDAADKQLAEAEAKLKAAAAYAKDEAAKQRVVAAATRLTKARASVRAAASSPAPPSPAKMRAPALDVNAAGMRAFGF